MNYMRVWNLFTVSRFKAQIDELRLLLVSPLDLTGFILEHKRFVKKIKMILILFFFSLQPYIATIIMLIFRKHLHISILTALSPALLSFGASIVGLVVMLYAIRESNYLKMTKEEAAKALLSGLKVEEIKISRNKIKLKKEF